MNYCLECGKSDTDIVCPSCLNKLKAFYTNRPVPNKQVVDLKWKPEEVDPEEVRRILQNIQLGASEKLKHVAVPRVVVAAARYSIEKQYAEVLRLERDIGLLKAGMAGDYDLDAWMDWCREVERGRQSGPGEPLDIEDLAFIKLALESALTAAGDDRGAVYYQRSLRILKRHMERPDAD
jgi:hypothetical protein